ncbi:cupredoxin domain-containing protein [Litchfieldia alkalitelluris]|uniref:cupredoxin domain-containing protein n=1 Tax=Litchfieldia alkalitelluris TaxID=304268 RepID=UPI000998BC71|nr:cupredoxin domain-containing protein [Litchfieldia alkalitelluris]
MQFIFIKKRWLFSIFFIAIILAGSFFLNQYTVPALSQEQEQAKNFSIHMVTGEFKTTTKDGKEIESYRWDPGTIQVPQGQEVTLSIFGVNGHEHPFRIEGTDIKGTVKKGEETIITLKFEKEGIYRLICEAHQDPSNNGPMIAYIVVD